MNSFTFENLRRTLLIAAAVLAVFAGGAAAQVKNVAVIETQIDARSGAAAALTPAEVALITTEIRREAVNNLPRSAYNIMTSKTIQAQGGAGLAECVDENCVITIGSKVGADYIVRGVISKFQTKLILSVEMYEIENGTLVASSNPIRSEKSAELLEMAAAACESMYKKFVDTQAKMPAQQNSARTAAAIQPVVTTQQTVTTQSPESHTANVSQPDGGSVPSAATNMDAYTYTAVKKDRTTTMPGDTVAVTKEFAGYDESGKIVYRITYKIFVGYGDRGQYGQQLSATKRPMYRPMYNTKTIYRSDGDAEPKLFVKYDANRNAIYRNLSVQKAQAAEIQKAQAARGAQAVREVQEAQETRAAPAVQKYEDFSVAVRLGTWAINSAIPGLGSYLLMEDWVGGTIQMAVGVTGYICFIYGVQWVQELEPYDNGGYTYYKLNEGPRSFGAMYVGVGLLTGTGIFNIVRSVKYNKPVSAHASTLKPYDGIKLAILPTESGDFKVFARYDYSF